MANIPLNKFRRYSSSLGTDSVIMYQAPERRAGIILTALSTNTTDSVKTVTIGISTQAMDQYFDLVKNISLDGYDAANVVVGKIVVEEGDYVVASSNDPLSGVNLTLSILEAIND